MEPVIIVKANVDQLSQCSRMLANSDIGRIYFSTMQVIESTMQKGLEAEEVYVALSTEGDCLGFLWFVYRGAFHSYPYLHIIVVDEMCRGRGIGSRLLDFYEQLVLPEYSKTFLLVADFNPRAKKLYESRGWREVGAIPDLYKPGITEYLMVKYREDDMR